MYRKTAKKLLKFIEKSPTAFQAVTEMTKRLDKEGFEELKEEDHWKLKKGGNYYVTRNHSAIIAFSIPQKPVWKFHIMASHSDSPSLKIKENPEIEVENAYIKLNVERYGGMILSPWFDRPLSVAGRLIVRQDGKIREKMVAVDRDLLVIPNLAIHMNRDVNKGVEINNQVDLMPVLDSIPEDERTTDYFLSFLARELSVEKSDIIDFELNTFCMEEPCFVGVNDTMISSPRIDNQSSCRALLDAIEDGNRADGINIIALFDHEEIGSNSKQGAASIMLHDMLRRILRNMDLSENRNR